ncbi:MAG: lipase [Gammaproteobacteria bacterium]|nr:lipase [Gammaproteobacteria bacterium]MBQ0838520.1 lipase [Gammaproteobacteria bacterium]
MNNLALRHYLLAIVALSLFGCSSNEMYRNDYKSVCTYKAVGSCAHSALQVSNPGAEEEYRLGFVEYDDHGQLRDPEQMQALVDAYYVFAATDDVLLITFVHGWHHSAKPEDGNIASFRKMLAQMSKTEALASQQQGRQKRKVLGVYIGWRGDSLTLPVVKNLTFWGRKNTAHQVGQQGVTEVLLKLEQIVNVKVGMSPKNPPPVNSRMVVIGHSFGGAVVYASLQKILADRFLDSRRGLTSQGDAKGFGDLVVLMNPAFEALRFAALYDTAQEGCRAYKDTQLPKLLILTSETDYATKYAFPAGRVFSTLFDSDVNLQRHFCEARSRAGIREMRVSEGQANRNTVGHFSPYLTHRLKPVVTQPSRGGEYQIKQIQSTWGQQKEPGAIDFVGSQLVSLGRTDALNPYLNVQVDKALIKDHNDIWGEEITSFIRDMIVISTTPSSAE